MTGLSRGSSAESSLKRTKRKAPPPPTSLTAAVQETVPLEENVQGLSVFTSVHFMITYWDCYVLFYHTFRLFHCWVEKNMSPFV